MVPWAVMISTGSRGCRSCTASISAMPSVGSMRRSSRATSNRPPSTAAMATWGSLVAVTSKPIVTRRISSTSTIAVSSSTTSTLRFTVASPARPARVVGGRFQVGRGSVGAGGASPVRIEGGLFEVRRGSAPRQRVQVRRGCASSLTALQLEVDLFEALEVRLQALRLLAHPHEVVIAPEELLAQPGQLGALPRQLVALHRQLRARSEQRLQRVAAARRPRRPLPRRGPRQGGPARLHGTLPR